MATSFPKLPGYVPMQDPTIADHKKKSHLYLEKTQNPKNQDVPLYALPRQKEQELVPEKSEKSLSYSQTVFQNHFGTDITQQFEPNFVKLHNQVLCFYGYFKESVVESNLENYRIRKLTLYYYLSDFMIYATEPKDLNSGMLQGVFIKRQMILRNDGSGVPVGIDDFKVGQPITLLGRQIMITDCDQYTREFYTNIKKPQADAIEEQEDSFTKSLVKKPPVKDHAMKDFLEHFLGGGRVMSQKQFLDKDRQVLRFFSICDELPYVIHYNLSDDTIEVNEVHFPNNGRQRFPVLMKRGKVPKNFDGVPQPGLLNPHIEYYKDSDIYPDKPFIAYSKLFKIIGVDGFTKQYYSEKYQRDFPEGKLEQEKAQEQVPIKVPPHNGFGNEDDSLGYVYKLLPKPPKKDFFKYVDNDKAVLRYTAKLNTEIFEDKDRRFIISYFLSDDTLSIFEPTVRNSGIKEGKFLERGKYRRSSSEEYLTPADIMMGGNVIINSFSFQVLSYDEFTAKYMEKLFPSQQK